MGPPRPALPPPVVTVVVPGRGPVASEVLATGAPADDRLPRRPVPPSRWVGLSAVAVLCAGVLQAATYEAPAAPAPPAPLPIRGVTATAVDAGTAGGPLVERFGLLVRVAPPPGRGDSGSPSEQDQVALLGVTGRGFFVETINAPLPAPLGPLDRSGASAGFYLEAQVSDCAIDSQAQRTLELQVQQGPRTGEVKVAVDGKVVRLLDRLVARTCRRPRG